MATQKNTLSLVSEFYGSDSEDEMQTPDTVITIPEVTVPEVPVPEVPVPEVPVPEAPGPEVTVPMEPVPEVPVPEVPVPEVPVPEVPVPEAPGPEVTGYFLNRLISKGHARKTVATPPFPEEDYIELEKMEDSNNEDESSIIQTKYTGVDLRDVLNKLRTVDTGTPAQFSGTDDKLDTHQFEMDLKMSMKDTDKFRFENTSGHTSNSAFRSSPGARSKYASSSSFHNSPGAHDKYGSHGSFHNSPDAHDKYGSRGSFRGSSGARDKYGSSGRDTVSNPDINRRHTDKQTKRGDYKQSEMSWQSIQPSQKKFKPYVPIQRVTDQEAFVFVNNQDVKDCATVDKNRYDTRALRNNIIIGLDDYKTINGLVVGGYMPPQVITRWKELSFGVRCNIDKQMLDMEYSFIKIIADVLADPKYSVNPQTLVLCITRNVHGDTTLLDLIKTGYKNGWKIIIWSWSSRIDYHIKKFCIHHAEIKLNYLDNAYGIFYSK